MYSVPSGHPQSPRKNHKAVAKNTTVATSPTSVAFSFVVDLLNTSRALMQTSGRNRHKPSRRPAREIRTCRTPGSYMSPSGSTGTPCTPANLWGHRSCSLPLPHTTHGDQRVRLEVIVRRQVAHAHVRREQSHGHLKPAVLARAAMSFRSSGCSLMFHGEMLFRVTK